MLLSAAVSPHTHCHSPPLTWSHPAPRGPERWRHPGYQWVPGHQSSPPQGSSSQTRPQEGGRRRWGVAAGRLTGDEDSGGDVSLGQHGLHHRLEVLQGTAGAAPRVQQHQRPAGPRQHPVSVAWGGHSVGSGRWGCHTSGGSRAAPDRRQRPGLQPYPEGTGGEQGQSGPAGKAGEVTETRTQGSGEDSSRSGQSQQGCSAASPEPCSSPAVELGRCSRAHPWAPLGLPCRGREGGGKGEA